MKPAPRWSVSPESFRCRAAIPSRRCVSSRDLGWRTLLVDVHSDIEWNEPYGAVTTLDPRIGVSLSGQYSSHYYSRGRWRPDVYRPGTTTVLRSEEARKFRFSPLGQPQCEFALVYFPLGQLEEVADYLRRPGQRLQVPWFNQVVAEDRALAQVVSSLIGAMSERANELYAETASTWLAAHVLMRTGAATEDARGEREISDSRLRRVLDYISENFGDPLSLAELAAEAGISKFHFARLFRQKVGVAPHLFLTRVRLDAARRMLLGTDLSIKEIAGRCGYVSAAHFTTAFSTQHGVPPSRLRAHG